MATQHKTGYVVHNITSYLSRSIEHVSREDASNYKVFVPIDYS